MRLCLEAYFPSNPIKIEILMHNPRIDQPRSALSSLLSHHFSRVSSLPSHHFSRVSSLPTHRWRRVSTLPTHQLRHACTARSHHSTVIHLVPSLLPYPAQLIPPQRLLHPVGPERVRAQKLQQPPALQDEQRRGWGWLRELLRVYLRSDRTSQSG
ncbi:hypothetical protein BDR07DRAFT_1424024 [Suillus spraguei]|nr:hypothetical protein BDR07DRAFT_1424024 [Suillus spraguei]